MKQQKVGLARRLGALFYDGLCLIALYMMSTAFILAFTDGAAIKPGNWLYNGFLLAIWYIFYTGFWIKAGQTLGMLAWKIRIESCDGKAINIKQASLRLCWAIPSLLCFGLGYIYLLFNTEKLALHDKLSNTRLIFDSKK